MSLSETLGFHINDIEHNFIKIKEFLEELPFPRCFNFMGKKAIDFSTEFFSISLLQSDKESIDYYFESYDLDINCEMILPLEGVPSDDYNRVIFHLAREIMKEYKGDSILLSFGGEPIFMRKNNQLIVNQRFIDSERPVSYDDRLKILESPYTFEVIQSNANDEDW